MIQFGQENCTMKLIGEATTYAEIRAKMAELRSQPEDGAGLFSYSLPQ